MLGEMDSMQRWCSSKAPWRARTPIVIDGVVMMYDMVVEYTGCCCCVEEVAELEAVCCNEFVLGVVREWL